MAVRRRLGLVGLVLALIGAPAAAAPPPSPKLVVALSMDQFSLELFERYRPTYAGGLRRLADGMVFAGYQSHAATETCPGHSTLLTGDHPARTGIVANNWLDRATGSNMYCVSVKGVADPNASGSAQLRVDTLGDWLKAQKPGSRSFAVSGKDRAAIMMAGHHADGVYWWMDGQGFTTSRYAGPATPKVLAPAKAFDRALFAAWRKRPPTLWPAEVPDRCKALEKTYTFGRAPPSGHLPPDASKGATQPRGFINDARFADQLKASPAFDPLALDFAEQLIAAEKIGHGPATDVLAVSLSSTDFVGHRYGNGGAEDCVHLATVDKALGGFFAHLDKLAVPYVVVLSADHGAIDAPERLGPPAQRIDTIAFVAALNRDLRSKFGLSYDPVAGDDPRQIIIGLAPDDDRRAADVRAEALRWLKTRPEVAAAFTADEIAASEPPPGKPVTDLTLAERFYESFDRDRSGDILVAYVERSTLGVPLSPVDNVASHGSPWDYDRRVPIAFWWRGAPSVSEGKPMETVDIAPTLAAMIGVKPPPIDGHCVELGQRCPK